MLLRKKLLIMISIALMLLILMSVAFWFSVFHKINNLDGTLISKKTQQVITALNRKQDDFQATAERQVEQQDLGSAYLNCADSTYNISYINNVFKNNTNLNFIKYLNVEGEQVFAAVFDYSGDVPENTNGLTAELSEHFAPSQMLFEQVLAGNQVSGILDLETGPVTLTAQVVKDQTPSDGKEAVRGILILGSYLDSTFCELLFPKESISIDIKNIKQTSLLNDYAPVYSAFSRGETEVTQILSEDKIAGYALLNDLYQQPTLLLQVQGTRDIYLHLKENIIYFICLNFLICFIFGLVILLFVEKALLQRLDQLNNCVNLVGANRDPASRIYLTGNDELKILANSINGMLEKLNLAQSELQKSEKRSHYLSFYDPLTGLVNRTYFEYEINRLNKNLANYLPMSIITLDIDGLKIVNDTFGHMAGDELLRSVAQILSSVVKKGDIVARIGGDEFCLLLPNVDRHECWQRKDMIVKFIKEHNVKTSFVGLSLSIGSATLSEENDENIFETFQRAENNMYNYKLSQSVSSKSKVIDILLAALSERDFIAQGHAERLMAMAEKMGTELSLSDERKRALILLAKVHDLGKVGIPDKILFKTEELTEEEYKKMKEHVQVGYNIASRSKELAFIAELILHHHERWDGKGYPSGMKGEEIPLECRILTILDAYDAMTNDRSYHKGIKPEEALQELTRCAGTQFEPFLVQKFKKIIMEDLSKQAKSSME